MISENLVRIKKELTGDVKLVVVSKFHPVEVVMQAYEAGQRVFGESRPQEMAGKYEKMPKDIEWHMIGNLQTNKIRMIVPFVSMIHSVDSLKLAAAISNEAVKAGRVIDILFEVRIAAEDSKIGWDAADLEACIAAGEFDGMPGIRIEGLMGMATYTGDKEWISSEFRKLHDLYMRFKELYLPRMNTLSMGMSDDYDIAIKNGSTMVRIGSKIFGDRKTRFD